MLAVFRFLLVPLALAGEPASRLIPSDITDRDQWHLEYTPRPRIAFALFENRSAPDGDVSEYVAFAAAPPELPQQRQVRSHFAMNGTLIRTSTVGDVSSYHRPLIMVRIGPRTRAERTNITLTVTHEVSLYLRHLVPGATRNPPPVLSPSERAGALSDPQGFGFRSPVFAAWLKETGLLRRSDETAITFARRVFSYMIEHVPNEVPCSYWDCPLAESCQKLRGDCGYHARLYVGIMRANGIPARCLVGWYLKVGEGPTDGDNHVKSEFFADGVGWVPVDSTWKKIENFGVEAGNFITLHLYAEEPIGMPTTHWGAQKRGCLMPIQMYCVGRPAGHPNFKTWHVASRLDRGPSAKPTQ